MNPAVQRYLEINRYRLSLDANWENFRFVCIDTESTGFDPARDRLVSLAGIGVAGGEILLWDTFQALVRVGHNTAAVTVHGITRQQAAEGLEEAAALAGFLEWLRDGVIVGHHLQHDLDLLNAACRRHFALQLRNVAVDALAIFDAVHRAGGFAGHALPQGRSLDALCERFHVVPHDRHTAPGDAFLVAQVLLRVLREARKRNCWNLRDLGAGYADQPLAEPHGNKP